MKVRNGFVSNSSSTSYNILVDKEEYQKALDQAEDFVQDLIKKLTDSKPKKLCDVDLVEIDYVTGSQNSWYDWGVKDVLPAETVTKIEEEYDGDWQDIVDEFLSKIPEDKQLKISVGI